MTTPPEVASTVHVRLSWLPYPESPTAGRLLAHRSVAAPAAPAVDEFWISDEVDAHDVRALRDAGTMFAWRRLLWGQAVLYLPGSVLLRPMVPADLGELNARLARRPWRPLFEISAAVVDDGSGPRCDAVDVAAAPRDVLSHALRPLLEPALDELVADATADPVRLDVPPEPDLRTAIHRHLELHDVNGVQVGDHNLQINRFVMRAPEVRLDFMAVLQRADVRRAVAELQNEPTNEALRQRLVDTLAGAGWAVESRPVHLAAGGVHRPGFLDLLGRLLLFDVGSDVRGLQIGDHNVQRNTFVYGVTSPGGAELLHARPDLARALVDYLCPSELAAPTLATLQRTFLKEIAALPVEWTDGRHRAVQLGPPGPLDVLTVNRTDGLTVGHGNRMRSTQHVEVGRARIAAPRPPSVREPVRRPARHGQVAEPVRRPVEVPAPTEPSRVRGRRPISRPGL